MKKVLFTFIITIGLSSLTFGQANNQENGSSWSTGNIGIGGTPSARFDVRLDNANDLPRIIFQESTTDPILRLIRSYGTSPGIRLWSFEVNSTGNLLFRSGEDTSGNIHDAVESRVIFTYDGRLGLGVLPGERIDAKAGVNQHAKIKLYATDEDYNSGMILKGNRPLANGGGTSTHYIGATGIGSYNLLIESDETTFFNNNSTTTMTLTADGNVGIGTGNTHGHKLGVLGSIAALEVKVAAHADWPDYVFKKDYKLLSLNEVDVFIQKNGHLPNVPSTKDVKEDKGFFLGEMSKKLLEKIEELTLYTIQQEKEIQELKKQNKKIDELEKLVKKLLKEKK